MELVTQHKILFILNYLSKQLRNSFNIGFVFMNKEYEYSDNQCDQFIINELQTFINDFIYNSLLIIQDNDIIKKDKKLECNICLDTIESNAYISHLPCGHIFHNSCFQQDTIDCCPYCRHKYINHEIIHEFAFFHQYFINEQKFNDSKLIIILENIYNLFNTIKELKCKSKLISYTNKLCKNKVKKIKLIIYQTDYYYKIDLKIKCGIHDFN